MKIYFANNLFDTPNRMFNKEVVDMIRMEIPEYEIYLPQENDSINDKVNSKPTPVDIFNVDNKELDSSDILIACIDGVEIDSGVSAEIGRFVARKEFLKEDIFIIGFYSDIRQNGEGDDRMYKNLYTKGAIEKHGVIVSTVDEIIQELKIFQNVLTD